MKMENRVKIKSNIGALVNLAAYSSEEDESSDTEEEEEEEDNVAFVRKILDDILLDVTAFRVKVELVSPESEEKDEFRRFVEEFVVSDHSSEEDDDDKSSTFDEYPTTDTTTSDGEESEILEANRLKRRRITPVKTKGELTLRDLPPIQDLQISVPETECVQVGTVSSSVDELVVIESLPNTPALDLDTVLFLDQGKRVLGQVFDVIGPVRNPAYCVRFNSKEEIASKKIVKGMKVWFAPRTEHTSYVFLEQLWRLKGSDASWKHDEEPPRNHLDYSDDEEEIRARKQFYQEKRFYRPPTVQQTSMNPFYRRNQQYSSRDFGPIQWNSGHMAPQSSSNSELKPPGT